MLSLVSFAMYLALVSVAYLQPLMSNSLQCLSYVFGELRYLNRTYKGTL